MQDSEDLTQSNYLYDRRLVLEIQADEMTMQQRSCTIVKVPIHKDSPLCVRDCLEMIREERPHLLRLDLSCVAVFWKGSEVFQEDRIEDMALVSVEISLLITRKLMEEQMVEQEAVRRMVEESRSMLGENKDTLVTIILNDGLECLTVNLRVMSYYCFRDVRAELKGLFEKHWTEYDETREEYKVFCNGEVFSDVGRRFDKLPQFEGDRINFRIQRVFSGGGEGGSLK